MPNYSYAGVYVTEFAQDTKPIEAVSSSTADLIGADVIAKLSQLASKKDGNWKEQNEHDPGIALLELFAWLTDMLLCRLSHASERHKLFAARLAAASLALSKDEPLPHDSVLKHIQFFEGKLLGGREPASSKACPQWRSFGGGIAHGLQLEIRERESTTVIDVTPGCAIDAYGHLISLDKRTSLQLPMACHLVSVIARPGGRGCCSIALFPSAECEFIAVEESKDGDFLIGKLERSTSGWRVAND